MSACVLLVDDDMMFVRRIARQIRASGREVLVALDGTSAVQKAKHNEPSLVFLNTDLRLMSCLAVCTAIRYMRFRATPLIVAVGTTVDDFAEEELEFAGFDAWLHLPIGDEALTLLLLNSEPGAHHLFRLH